MWLLSNFQHILRSRDSFGDRVVVCADDISIWNVMRLIISCGLDGDVIVERWWSPERDVPIKLIESTWNASGGESLWDWALKWMRPNGTDAIDYRNDTRVCLFGVQQANLGRSMSKRPHLCIVSSNWIRLDFWLKIWFLLMPMDSARPSLDASRRQCSMSLTRTTVTDGYCERWMEPAQRKYAFSWWNGTDVEPFELI